MNKVKEEEFMEKANLVMKKTGRKLMRELE